MENDVIKYFLSQGPFAVLFVWLLLYVMRANKEREGRLQDLLDKFSGSGGAGGTGYQDSQGSPQLVSNISGSAGTKGTDGAGGTLTAVKIET